MLAAGWPDERSIQASLIKPVDALEVTKLFERRAASPQPRKGQLHEVHRWG
jgi:hypothetical protein